MDLLFARSGPVGTSYVSHVPLLHWARSIDASSRAEAVMLEVKFEVQHR
jgi:hypothetical protein